MSPEKGKTREYSLDEFRQEIKDLAKTFPGKIKAVDKFPPNHPLLKKYGVAEGFAVESVKGETIIVGLSPKGFITDDIPFEENTITLIGQISIIKTAPNNPLSPADYIHTLQTTWSNKVTSSKTDDTSPYVAQYGDNEFNLEKEIWGSEIPFGSLGKIIRKFIEEDIPAFERFRSGLAVRT